MNEPETNFGQIARSCTLFNTRKAARAITEVYETILAPSGVHATQFMLLVAIKNYAPVSMSHLAQGLQTDRTTLTRTLKPLQENGWVAMAPGKDKRVQEVRITMEGDDALSKAVPLWEAAQNYVEVQLGGKQWEQLLTHLQSAAALKTP